MQHVFICSSYFHLLNALTIRADNKFIILYDNQLKISALEPALLTTFPEVKFLVWSFQDDKGLLRWPIGLLVNFIAKKKKQKTVTLMKTLMRDGVHYVLAVSLFNWLKLFRCSFRENTLVSRLIETNSKVFIHDEFYLMSQYLYHLIDNVYLYEDGKKNYAASRYPHGVSIAYFLIRLFRFARFSFSPIYYPGNYHKIKNIYCAHVEELPEQIREKGVYFSFEDASVSEVKNIRRFASLFNVDEQVVDSINSNEKSVIIMGQPLVHDGIIPMEKKIEIYEYMLNELKVEYAIDQIFYKLHPREIGAESEQEFSDWLKSLGVQRIVDPIPMEAYGFVLNTQILLMSVFSTARLSFANISVRTLLKEAPETESQYREMLLSRFKTVES